MRPGLLAAVVLAIALPWYLAVGIKTGGAWTSDFFFKHNIGRFLQPIDGHRGTFFFQGLVLIACFFPWSFLLPVGIRHLVRRLRQADRQAAGYLLAASWIGVWFAVFSISGTKLPSYVLPAYPVLAILCGAWVADWIARPARRATWRFLAVGWGALTVSGVGLGIGVALAMAHWFPALIKLGWIGAIPAVGGVAGWCFHRRREPSRAFASLAVTAVALCVALLAVAAEPISKHQNGAQFADLLRQFDGGRRRSACFTSARRV